jgi:hypothetical protein
MILHGPEPVLELDPIALHGCRLGQENDLVGLKGFFYKVQSLGLVGARALALNSV